MEPRMPATATKQRPTTEPDLPSDVEGATLRASAALLDLEERGNLAGLLSLAEVYRQRAELSRRYGELQQVAARLRQVTSEYDRVLLASTADDLADQLKARGVRVLALNAGSSPSSLTEASRIYARLARIASEAAAGIKADQAGAPA